MALPKVVIKDFSKGLVTNVRNEKMADNEFPILKNWDFETRGGITRRLGFADIKNSNTAFNGNLQGYIRFIAKPYRLKDLGNLFDFNAHSVPLETDPTQEFILLAVNGKLKLHEKVSTSLGTTIATFDKFEPKNLGWDETVIVDPDEALILTNNSNGDLNVVMNSKSIIQLM